VEGRHAAEVGLEEGRGIPDPLGVDHPDEGTVPHQGQLPLREAGEPQLELLGGGTEGLRPAGDFELEQGGEVGKGRGTHLVGARLKPVLGLAGVEALGEETAHPGLGMVQISATSLRGGVEGEALHKKTNPALVPPVEKCEQLCFCIPLT
jgi:hypothetical protein